MKFRLIGTVVGMAFAATFANSASAADSKGGGKLAFAVRDWFTSVYESKFMDECPEGLAISGDEVWWRGLNKKDRARLTDNGLIQTLNRWGQAVRRGPNGVDICLNPSASTGDPVQRIVEGKYSYGADLDGTKDGHATAKSCAHEKFIDANDDNKLVDNQFYRLVGCTYGWRHVGLVDLNANEMRGTSGLGMILIEVTGVDDPRNDDDVTVTFYRSVDQFALDPVGAPLPFSSYRIETVDGKPRYSDSLKGSIKDGVIETKRGDVKLPFYGNYNFMHPVIKDMGLKLTVAEDGNSATGMVTGYYDLAMMLYWIGGMGPTIPVSYYNCPSVDTAARKLADGYPDPKTGECTSISSAFNIKAYSAFAIHPETERREAKR